MNDYLQDGELGKLDFGDTSSLSEEKAINIKKFANNIIREAKNRAKPDNCFFCKKPTTGFCNSHSVPSFLLKNISENGTLYNTNKILQNPISSHETGINKTGVFHLICRDCDSKIFKEYETPSNYNTLPTDKMLNQIALKNYLKNIYKRRNEIELFKIAKSKNIENPFLDDYAYMKLNISLEDLDEYIKDFNQCKKSLNSKSDNFNLLFYKKLDYIVPYAFQEKIALICDFNDVVINNIYLGPDKHKIKELHVCIFPFENSSIIFLFSEKEHNRYRNFKKQLDRMDLETQLKAINFMVFAYSEDIFIHSNIEESLLFNENLKKVAQLISDYEGFSEPNIKTAIEGFSFKNMNSIVNLLSKEFSIRQIK